MKIFKNKEQLQREIGNKKSISFVPTMGGLHKGHISLIKTAKKYTNETLVSIYVNPKQFNREEDYKKYPRNLTKDLKICGEIILPVHHFCLSKNTNLTKIKTIYAHGQSLAQCHDWLMNNLPDIKKVAVMSNAEGARLASKEKNTAAIASNRAADLFKLNVLQQNIEDEQNNSTRFLVLSRQDVKPSSNDKTSIVVATKNKPGAIAELVAPFAKNKVSMTKLESRPAKIGMWEYVFFIDVEGHQTKKSVKAALNVIESKASFMKILGSYPKN